MDSKRRCQSSPSAGTACCPERHHDGGIPRLGFAARYTAKARRWLSPLLGSGIPACRTFSKSSRTRRLPAVQFCCPSLSLVSDDNRSSAEERAIRIACWLSAERNLMLQVGIAGEEYGPEPNTPPGTPSANGRRIMLSLVSNPGNSGGPVFDHWGQVVGFLKGNLFAPMDEG
jgi:hypothetical protein